jgi:hypothetical protein
VTIATWYTDSGQDVAHVLSIVDDAGGEASVSTWTTATVASGVHHDAGPAGGLSATTVIAPRGRTAPTILLACTGIGWESQNASDDSRNAQGALTKSAQERSPRHAGRHLLCCQTNLVKHGSLPSGDHGEIQGRESLSIQ